jgi:SAM-dependent methyltransferase
MVSHERKAAVMATKLDAQHLKCPLCGGDNVISIKMVAADSIANYWKAVDYDVQSAIPHWPSQIEKWQCLDCDLRFFEPQAIGGPDFYRALGRTPIYYGPAKWEFVEVLRWLSRRKAGGSILEYGCGRGWFLEASSRYFERAVGIDFNQEAVKDCRGRGLDVRAIDLEQLDATFDVIASFQVIEHVASPGEILRRLAALLRPGGALIVAVPNEDSLLGELNHNYLNLPPHHASCWTEKALAHVAELLSLDLENYLREPLGPDLYLAALQERFDRYLTVRSTVMRPWVWLVRRLAIALALANFDLIRTELLGHTHIAIFRKSAESVPARLR